MRQVSVWTRHEFITQGPDPTVVVEWRNDTTKMAITEFQQTYLTTLNGLQVDDSSAYWEMLHEQLESEWQTMQEIEAAGFSGCDRGYYGGS